MNSELVEMTGRRFTRLVVVRSAGPSKKGHRWECACDCGNSTTVNGCNLRSGNVHSCGCLTREAVTKHGKCATTEYIAWRNMIRRCTYPKDRSYINYGGRGIKVCELWMNFKRFLADMGEKPTPSHSLDRVDTNGNYEPSNCRWATRIEQGNNTTKNMMVCINGRCDTLANWVRLTNINSYKKVYSRIRREGMDPSRALQL